MYREKQHSHIWWCTLFVSKLRRMIMFVLQAKVTSTCTNMMKTSDGMSSKTITRAC